MAGSAHPNYKHGKHSKYLKHLPQELHEGYKATVGDEELLSLTGELGVLGARQFQLLDKLGEVEAPPWGEAVEALNDVKMAKGDDKKQEAFVELERIIREGAGAARAQGSIWSELREVMQERGKLSALEWKRLNDLHGVVEAEKVLLFVRAALHSVGEVVTDREQLRAVHAKMLALMPPARS